MHLSPHTRTAIYIVLRSRFLWLGGCLFLVLLLAAFLASQFSGRQAATVALDVGLSVIRLSLPIVVILMTQQLLSAELERRYIFNSISYPHCRSSFLYGRVAAGAALTLGLLLVFSAALALLVSLISNTYPQGTPVALGTPYLIVVAFIGLDILLINAVAALLAIIASTPSFVLVGTLGFMLVARSFGAIIELLTYDSGVVSDAESYRSNLGLLSYLLPDLGALDVRMIALYGQLDYLPSDWPWLVLSTLTYTVGLLGLADRALQGKRFV